MCVCVYVWGGAGCVCECEGLIKRRPTTREQRGNLKQGPFNEAADRLFVPLNTA